MKRFLLVLVIAAWGTAGYAQTPSKPDALERASETPAEGEHGSLEAWKWANFVLLAAGLGYLIRKNAGPFFAARSKKIQQDMVDAEELRRDAEKRAADVDRRLANLAADIASLKAESQAEAQAETQRSMQHTAAEIAKIQAHAENEIVAAGKAARMDLKRYSAELAVQLAEQRIAGRMTGEAQDNLVRGFVHDLKHPAS
ncbi:MAG TPA: ATP synthase F0 subunit B [Candidatus Sulfopaludibacter sp.]|jgi:F-type H+-transporting ATPase subunit b|nr:ATP synthase F0 subunit B [Candidatus Sulfopaludibacter sp.]